MDERQEAADLKADFIRLATIAGRLWAEVKGADLPITLLTQALAMAEERGKAAARAEAEAKLAEVTLDRDRLRAVLEAK